MNLLKISVEELADVKEVIDALSGIRGEEVRRVQEGKREERGGFCLLEFLRGRRGVNFGLAVF